MIAQLKGTTLQAGATSCVVEVGGIGLLVHVTPGTAAANILKGCASGPDYAFLPASGADLKADFAAIGRDITRLRISR